MEITREQIEDLSKNFEKSLLKYPYRLKSMPFKGNKIYYMDKGSGQAVFFVHGLGEDSSSWELNMNYFLKKGYRVIAIDLPGFGRSKGYTKVSINDFSESIYELIRYLQLNKPVLIGHSMGGQACANFSIKHNEHIDKLVLVAPAGIQKYSPTFFKIYFTMLENVFLNKRSIDYFEKVHTLMHLNPLFMVNDLITKKDDSLETQLDKAMKFAQNITFFLKNDFTKRLIKRRIKKLFEYGFMEQYNENKMGMEAMLDKKELIQAYDIKAPTLLIWGTNDIMVPYRIASVAKMSIGSNAKLKSFTSCGHYSFAERTQEFNESVYEFISN